MRLIIAAILAVLFVIPASAQQYRAMTGQRLDFSSGTTTSTYHAYDFGATSDAVRVCLTDASVPVYIRFGTTVTTSPTALSV